MQAVGGAFSIAVGLIVGALIHLHPEGLRVPAWVAYVAASAFALTGLSLLAGALEAIRLQRWLGVAVALSLLAVGSWIAIGPGERACSMSIPFLRTAAPEAVCRGAFGLGALLVALVLGVLARRAIKSDRRN
jgi:hypothetical protein